MKKVILMMCLILGLFAGNSYVFASIDAVLFNPNANPSYKNWQSRLTGEDGDETLYLTYGPDIVGYGGYGSGNTTPVMGDVNGDGLADAVLVNNSTGYWESRLTGYVDGNLYLAAGPDVPHYGGGYGGANPKVMGDVNGDGLADAAVYNPSNGHWAARLTGYVDGTLYLTAGPDVPHYGGGFGNSSSVALMGDVNGDGLADAVVFNDGSWIARLTGYVDGTLYLCAGPDITNPSGHNYGTSDFIPLLGDVNDDGLADAILFNPSNGHWEARLTAYVDGTLYLASGDDVSGFTGYGTSDYTPLVGNVDGDVIPEPASVGLMLMGILGLLRRKE